MRHAKTSLALRGEALLFVFTGLGGLLTFVGAAFNASAHSQVELALRFSAAAAAVVTGLGLLRGRRWGVASSLVWVVVQITAIGVTLASTIRERGVPHHSAGHWILIALIFTVALGCIAAVVAKVWRTRTTLV